MHSIHSEHEMNSTIICRQHAEEHKSSQWTDRHTDTNSLTTYQAGFIVHLTLYE